MLMRNIILSNSSSDNHTTITDCERGTVGGIKGGEKRRVKGDGGKVIKVHCVCVQIA
jgi:hypothetical protein